MVQQTLQYGELKIADEVIAMIAMIAVSEVDGVANTVSGVKEELVRAINKRSMPKGISVSSDDDGVIITLKVAVYFTSKIRDVCHELQSAIKTQVEMMSGIPVHEVNIMVEQVNFSEELKDNE
jgi:uncharacterized alkaline shock family protein YloU